MWYVVIAAVLAALGFSASSKTPELPETPPPPPPESPPRCAELVFDEAWVAEHRDRISRALTNLNAYPPSSPAVPAVLEMMQTLAPECDWTPSTTTDLVGLDGVRIRFDAVLRELHGVTLADATGIVAEFRGNAHGEGMSPTPRSLLEVMLAVLPPVVVEPPRPTPPKPTPIPPREGEGGPTPTPTPKPKCTRMRADGPASVCLTRLAGGVWTWSWSSPAGDQLSGEAQNAGDAAILAYQDAAARYPVPWIVQEPVTRSGVRLEPSGELEVFDAVAWGLAVHRRLREQWDADERDPMGLTLAALQLVFPHVNWFRVVPVGGLPAAAARVANVVQQSAAEPDLIDRIARAIVGATADPLNHVFRGRRVELKASPQGWYQYRIDNGQWTGAFQNVLGALNAAHGGG